MPEVVETLKKLNSTLTAPVRPLFLEDEYKQRWTPLASCVLVSLDGAGHVMRKDGFPNEFNRAAVALVTPTGRLVSFAKWEGLFTRQPSEGQELDIGFARIENQASSALEDCHFLAEDERQFNHVDDHSSKSFYMLIGYPGSRGLTKMEPADKATVTLRLHQPCTGRVV